VAEEIVETERAAKRRVDRIVVLIQANHRTPDVVIRDDASRSLAVTFHKALGLLT